MEIKKQQDSIIGSNKSNRNHFEDDIDLEGIFNKAQTIEISTDVDIDDLDGANDKNNLVKFEDKKSIKDSNLVYKSAINLNKIAYESLKMSCVAKTFSLSQDPPAGFGNLGHNHQLIFLEQQKQIKNNQYQNDFNDLKNSALPLKVWRGFHGNIYFEPFQLSNLKQSNDLVNEALKKLENTTDKNIIKDIKKCQKTKSAPITKTKQSIEINNKRNKSFEKSKEPDLIILQDFTSSTSKIILTERPVKQSKRFYSKSADLTSKSSIQNFKNSNNKIEIDDDKKSYHIVLPSNEIDKSEHTSTHHITETLINNQSNTSSSSASSHHNQPPEKTFITEFNPDLFFYTNNNNNNRHSSKSICFDYIVDKMDNSNMKVINATYDKQSTKQKQIRDFNTTPFFNLEREILLTTNDYSNNNNLKRKAHMNNKITNYKPILPNLSAVKKQNIPIKGLAFRELTQRIILSSNERNDVESQFELNIQPRNLNADQINNEKKQNSLIEASLINTTSNNSNNSVTGYRDYKQMLRNVRKGVTINQREKTEFFSRNSYNQENRYLSVATPLNNISGSANSSENSKSNSKNSQTPNQQKSTPIANRLKNRSVSQNVLKKLKINGAKIDVTNTNSSTSNKPFLYQHPQAPPSTSLGYNRKITHYVQNSPLNTSMSSEIGFNNNRIKSFQNNSIKHNPTPDMY